MKTYSYGSTSKFAKGNMIFYIVSICIALLQAILAFVQTTHILGFVFALFLLGVSCFMLWWVWTLNKNDFVESKRTLLIVIAIAVGALCLFVLILLIIKLLTFMFSPDLRSQAVKDVRSFDLDLIDIGINKEQFMANPEGYSQEVFDDTWQRKWENFRTCASRGIQTRVQNNEFVVDILKGDVHLYFHINQSDAVLGLVVDKGIYFDLLKWKGATMCQTRIGHSAQGSPEDITKACTQLIWNCLIEAFKNGSPETHTEEKLESI